MRRLRLFGRAVCAVNGHRVVGAPGGWSERPCVTCGRMVFVYRRTV
jgi:hypothetical protein